MKSLKYKPSPSVNIMCFIHVSWVRDVCPVYIVEHIDMCTFVNVEYVYNKFAKEKSKIDMSSLLPNIESFSSSAYGTTRFFMPFNGISSLLSKYVLRIAATAPETAAVSK